MHTTERRHMGFHLKVRRVRDPIVDFPGSRKELPEHGTIRGQARQLRDVLGKTHTTVRSTHAEAIFAVEEAFRCRGHKI